MKYLIVFFLIVASTWSLHNNSSLKLVHVFFRHGSRIPDEHELYHSHERYEHYQRIGFGKLTNAGKLKSYQLGKALRKRYNDFLGDDFDSDSVFVRSTNVERTKMTALLVLAGLFPPSKIDRWSDELNWIPIPFTYSENDYYVENPYFYCPLHRREVEKMFQSDEVKALKEKYRSTFELAINKTGKNYSTLKDMFLLHQLIHVEQTMNLTVPGWALEAFPDILHIATMQGYYETANTLMKRLNGGRMLAKVVENMRQKINGTMQPPQRKIFLYSGHDYTIVNMLSTLNLYELHFPNFNAAICIELHQDSTTNAYFVKVFYMKDVFSEPELQTMPECESTCEFNKFLDTYHAHLPINYTEECESSIPLD